jgi:hypothetical protein
MRVGVACVVAVLVATTLPGASTAGSYLPPPGDTRPVWSPDGSRIAFTTSRDGHALVIKPLGEGDETRLAEGATVISTAISPDWRWVAFTRFEAGEQVLRVVGIDGAGEHRLASAGFGARPAWSPDSRKLAFRAADGTLSIVDIHSTAIIRIAPGGASPAWSPDANAIAFHGGGDDAPNLYLSDPGGVVVRLLAGGPGAQIEPKWSPDGARIAFLTQKDDGKPFRFGVTFSDGTELVTYPGPRLSNSDSWAWMPSSDGILFSRLDSGGLFRLDLEDGATSRLKSWGATPTPSPDGRSIAFAGGGECRDRSGVYIARSDGTQAYRVTNDCRLFGSPGDDVIRGTGLADLLLGLAGDDRLFGLSAGYVGDTLRGADGDDVLVGSTSGDLLRGGAGTDRLFGGLSADELYGGSGSDRIAAQAGRDFVHARDGERDVVICGTNRGGTPERDEAWVDRVDVVRDCEIVHRGR